MHDVAKQTTRTGGLPAGVRLVLVILAMPGVLAVFLFVSAGRLDWSIGWLYLALIAINTAVSYTYIDRRNPDLMMKRARLCRGTKTWDIILLAAFSLLSVAIYVAAALDSARFGESEIEPLISWPIGCLVFLFGGFVIAWSLGENPFFEKSVRIQREYGHRVIDSGPYRVVRHPGDVGFTAWLVSAPLLLGPWCLFVPAYLSTVVLAIRTALVDQTLSADLSG